MSFKLGVKGIQEVLVIVLMIVFVFVLYSPMELTTKIGVAVLVFSIILLTTMATQAMKEAEERQRLQSR
jgi:hypothetical protein